MKPGRELDALVAEKVMGWRIVDPRISFAEGWPPNAPPQLNKQPVPHYSTDIAAAWEVVETVRSDGYEFQLKVPRKPEPGIIAPVFAAFHKETPPLRYAQGDDVPQAICLAALKAVAVDVEK